jgi:hypothetical protein
MFDKGSQRILVLAMAAIPLLLAGCGGGDGSRSEADVKTGPPLTKSQFIAQADAVCNEADSEQLRQSVHFVRQNPDAKREDLLVPAGLPPLRKQVKKIEALTPPAADEKAIEAMLRAFEEGIEQAEEDPASAFEASGGAFEEANKLAAGYGLQVCDKAP